MLAPVDNQPPVDQNVVDAHRKLLRLLEGGRRPHRVWIEHHNVRLHTVPQNTPALQPKSLGRYRRHLLHGLLQAEQALFTDQLAQNVGEGAVATRIRPVVGEETVAAHHLRRVLEYSAYVVLIARPRYERHVQVLLNEQVAYRVHHALALSIGHVYQGAALPLFVLIRTDVAEDVVLQAAAPLGIDLLLDLLPYLP